MAVTVSNRDIKRAVDLVVGSKMAQKSMLAQRLGGTTQSGLDKADVLMKVLEDYGVVSAARDAGLTQEVLLSKGSAAVTKVKQKIDERGEAKRQRRREAAEQTDAEPMAAVEAAPGGRETPRVYTQMSAGEVEQELRTQREARMDLPEPPSNEQMLDALDLTLEADSVDIALVADRLGLDLVGANQVVRQLVDDQVITGNRGEGAAVSHDRTATARKLAGVVDKYTVYRDEELTGGGSQDEPAVGAQVSVDEPVEPAQEQSQPQTVQPQQQAAGGTPSPDTSGADEELVDTARSVSDNGLLEVDGIEVSDPGRFADANPMNGTSWRKWFEDTATSKEKAALRGIAADKEKATQGFRDRFKNKTLFGKKRKTPEQVERIKRSHDEMAKMYALSVARPLQQGINIDAVANVATSAVMMALVSPRCREVIKEDVSGAAKSWLETARARLGGKKPGMFSTPDQRKKAEADKSAQIKSFDARLAAMESSTDHVPMSVDAAAETLVGINDAAYDDMRRGEPADLVTKQHADLVSALRKDWKKDGLDFHEIQDRALGKIAEQINQDPGYASRYQQLAYGHMRPEVEYTDKAGNPRWTGNWRITATNEKTKLTKDFLSPRAPGDAAAHIVGAGNSLVRDVVRAGRTHGAEGVNQVLSGYHAALRAPELMMGTQSTPGSMSDLTAASQRRARGMMQGVMEDGTVPPRDVAALMSESFNKSYTVLAQEEPAMMKEFEAKYGDGFFDRVDTLVTEARGGAHGSREVPVANSVGVLEDDGHQPDATSAGVTQENTTADDTQQPRSQVPATPAATAQKLGEVPVAAQRAQPVGRWSAAEQHQRQGGETPEVPDQQDITQTAPPVKPQPQQANGRWTREQNNDPQAALESGGVRRAAVVQPQPEPETETGEPVNRSTSGTATVDPETDPTNPRSTARRNARVRASTRRALQVDLRDKEAAAASAGGDSRDSGPDGQSGRGKTEERSHTAEDKKAREQQVRSKSEQHSLPRTEEKLTSEPLRQQAPVNIAADQQTPAQRSAAETYQGDYGRVADAVKSKISVDYDDPRTSGTVEKGTNGVRQPTSAHRARQQNVRTSFRRRQELDRLRQTATSDPEAASKEAKKLDLEL